MLQELTVRNFALLEEVRLAFGEGLNVLTGETGAGKSIIIDAITTVLGGRASADAIRTGAERASVEAVFALPPAEKGSEPLRALLDELGLADDVPSGADGADGADGAGEATVILSRDLSRSGRNVARVNGRAVPVGTLAQLGSLLIDLHGQHEHLSLLRPGAQRDLLDRYGGLAGSRAKVAALVKELRATRAQLAAMRQDEREVARRIDLLSFQVEEIQSARLVPGEEDSLTAERNRLANAARLAELAGTIHEALAGGAAGGEAPSALDLLGLAARDLAQLCRIDREMTAHEPLLVEATAQVEELARTMQRYQDSVEFAPERLDQVTERLDLIRELQRKYGASIEEVLAFGETAGAELEGLVNREARTAELEARASELEQQIGREAARLSAARRQAGEALATAVAQELRALSLRGNFSVELTHESDANGVPVPPLAGDSAAEVVGHKWADLSEVPVPPLAGDSAAGEQRMRFDESGIDLVDFRFAPNPGEPSKSVARTASGGELSRILLALKAVLSAADRTPTLIFDEIDTGVGGRNGQVIGEKLAQLGERHQVLCVTHLPQIAAYGDSHYYIAKHVQGGRTVTTVTPLRHEQRLDELAQMLGGVSAATRQQAQELTARASAWKQERQATTAAAASALPAYPVVAAKPAAPVDQTAKAASRPERQPASAPSARRKPKRATKPKAQAKAPTKAPTTTEPTEPTEPDEVLQAALV